jgi:hypothetical protein
VTISPAPQLAASSTAFITCGRTVSFVIVMRPASLLPAPSKASL